MGCRRLEYNHNFLSVSVGEKRLAHQKKHKDYYPFGSNMPGRSFTSEKYRFGFNGKENDTEYGATSIQDYGFRIYNPALGKFLSVDPLTASYPWYTPYQFAGNMPIVAIDLDGLEEYIYTRNWSKKDGHYVMLNSRFWSHGSPSELAFSTALKTMHGLYKNDKVIWGIGKKSYFYNVKETKVENKKKVNYGRYGSRLIGDGTYSTLVELNSRNYGILTMDKFTDENGNSFTIVNYYPNNKKEAIIDGIGHVFYGAINIFASGGLELITGGSATAISVPGLAYGIDESWGGIITIYKAVDGQYDSDESSENLDNRPLRGFLQILDKEGNLVKVYDIGEIVLNAKGAVTLTAKQTKKITDLIGVYQVQTLPKNK